jgi:poly(3-hydroxybutyrate) depolymerase
VAGFCSAGTVGFRSALAISAELPVAVPQEKDRPVKVIAKMKFKGGIYTATATNPETGGKFGVASNMLGTVLEILRAWAALKGHEIQTVDAGS